MMAVLRSGLPNSQWDPRLQWSGSPQAAATGMSVASDVDGGFLVQTQFMAELLKPIFDGGQIASRIRRIPLGANFNSLRMNGVDETSRATGSRWGGVRSYWTNEAGLMTASAPKFKQISMEIEKLTGLIYMTEELLADGMALEAFVREAFLSEFTFQIEDNILNGNGSGKPLGILNSPALITAAAEGSQAAATLTGRNILNMWKRMPARSRPNAVWLINQDVEDQLLSLHVPVRNIAGNENVGGVVPTGGVSYIPQGYLPGQQWGLLMGRPVIPTEYNATLGTAGDIVLADLSQYLGIEKGGVESAASMHVRFLYNEMAYRFVLRFNGMPLWSSAITPYKGSTTLSPFVALASR